MYPNKNMSEKGGSVHHVNAADVFYLGRDEMLEARRIWSDWRSTDDGAQCPREVKARLLWTAG